MMVALECWLLCTVAAWLRIFAAVDFFSLPRWALFVVAAVLAASTDYFAKRKYEHFREQFDGWPDWKRARWDLGVVITVVGIFALMMYSVVQARDHAGKKRPNQSLEPTTMLGTSAAEQPLVPSMVVAHL